MEQGFEKADSGNLPKIDTFMLHMFYKDNPNFVSAEIRNVKTKRASREEYSDEAIGFVQVQRQNNACIVKCKVTPEHRVHDKAYKVSVTVDETEEKIISCECHDCTASSGGCKHSIAFLYWLYRRSEEPSSTSVECYWRASSLSKIGKSLKAMSLNEMFHGPALQSKNADFVNKMIATGKAANSKCLLIQQALEENVVERISIHNLMVNYCKSIKIANNIPNAEDFINFCRENISIDDCIIIRKLTEMQSKSSAWHESRYCRVTASRLYETARCKTNDGALIEKFFGASKIPETEAMVRGLRLEDSVLAVISQTRDIVVQKCEIELDPDHPIFGASPDGVTEDYCIEVKCPSKEKNVNSYLSDKGIISNKYLAQIQLQMFMTNRKKGLFCVASPNFENNKEVTVVDVDFDKDFCSEFMVLAENYWNSAVFPKLIFN